MKHAIAGTLALMVTASLVASCSSGTSSSSAGDGGTEDGAASTHASSRSSGSKRDAGHDGGTDARFSSGPGSSTGSWTGSASGSSHASASSSRSGSGAGSSSRASAISTSGSSSGTGTGHDAGPPPACSSTTPCLYVAQDSAGQDTGVDCADAHAVSWFNDASSWGSSTGRIGPGTIVHLCGVIDVPAGTTGLTVQGSGTSSAPITIFFEPGAVLESPYFPTNNYNEAALVMMNQSWIVVDGGTNGVIQDTLNGTPGAACPGGACS